MMEAQLAYWKEQLHDPLPVLELPTDHPRGTAVYLRTARQPLDLPKALFEALKDLSQQEGSTLFMTCLAAFKMLLYGYTGQEDLCVATLVANRTQRETEGADWPFREYGDSPYCTLVATRRVGRCCSGSGRPSLAAYRPPRSPL